VEALNNVIKHAQASSISIRLNQAPERVLLVVEDDGAGFDPDQIPDGGFGLKSIRERVEMIHGVCTIISHPDKGTTITVEVRNEPNQNSVGG